MYTSNLFGDEVCENNENEKMKKKRSFFLKQHFKNDQFKAFLSKKSNQAKVCSQNAQMT